MTGVKVRVRHENTRDLHIKLAQPVFEKLVAMSERTGLSRSAVISTLVAAAHEQEVQGQ